MSSPKSTDKPQGLERTVRKAVNLVRQQLGDKSRQLQLFDEPQLAPVDTSGLDLSPNEKRCLQGIVELLDETGYKGHFTVTHESSGGYAPAGAKIVVPGLYVSEPELLEAFGLDRDSKGRYQSAQRKQLRDALESLATKRRHIYYERRDSEGSFTVRVSTTVIQYDIVDKFTEDIRAVKGGQADPRATYYTITPHHFVVDGINSFYLLQELQLYKKADEALYKLRGTRKGKKVDYHIQFIEWLQSSDGLWTIKLSTLAERLRLGYHVESRHRYRAETAIQQAIDVALELGYLEDYSIRTNLDGETVYDFVPNIEYMSRAQAKQKRLKS